MALSDIVNRQAVAEPWVEGEKIPWHDPEFSRRMLGEHLNQQHDAASRLARLGHECVGIDISPASIAYATAQADEQSLHCLYSLQDMRTADYGRGYGLVMLIFGEFNVFRRDDARAILDRAQAALCPGGVLLLEPHTFSAVREIGERAAHWYSAPSGVFSDQPYLCLRESFWHPDLATATERYFAVDAQTGGVTRYASSMQAYTNAEYRVLLSERGFGDIRFHPSMGGGSAEQESGLVAITARKL